MSSFIYPDSGTRKMYGRAGRKAAQQAKRFNEVLIRERTNHEKELAKLTDRITEYKKLPWYKKLWYLFLNALGYKKDFFV